MLPPAASIFSFAVMENLCGLVGSLRTLNKVPHFGNHTTYSRTVIMLHRLAQPAQPQRLDRALLVAAVADRALVPGDTQPSHRRMLRRTRPSASPAPPPESAGGRG